VVVVVCGFLYFLDSGRTSSFRCCVGGVLARRMWGTSSLSTLRPSGHSSRHLLLLLLLLPLPAQWRHAAAPFFLPFLHLPVQSVLADILDDASGEEVVHAHSLSEELSDSGTRDVIRNQLPDHVYILQPVLSKIIAPLLQRRQRIVDC
jgi:hypothetical protein